jgi:hypothetical protein
VLCFFCSAIFIVGVIGGIYFYALDEIFMGTILSTAAENRRKSTLHSFPTTSALQQQIEQNY